MYGIAKNFSMVNKTYTMKFYQNFYVQLNLWLKNVKKKHGVTHHILTRCQSIFSKTHRLSPQRLELQRGNFNLIEQWILGRLKSSWASPIHLVLQSKWSLWQLLLKQFQINIVHLIFRIFLILNLKNTFKT